MKNKIKAFLRSLGKGPNQIANKLRNLKINGKMLSMIECPLANVLKKKFRRVFSVDGINVYIDYNREAGLPWLQCCDDNKFLKLNFACYKFASKFDKGNYPQLINKRKCNSLYL